MKGTGVIAGPPRMSGGILIKGSLTVSYNQMCLLHIITCVTLMIRQDVEKLSLGWELG